jgi:hypothetical protein
MQMPVRTCCPVTEIQGFVIDAVFAGNRRSTLLLIALP